MRAWIDMPIICVARKTGVVVLAVNLFTVSSKKQVADDAQDKLDDLIVYRVFVFYG